MRRAVLLVLLPALVSCGGDKADGRPAGPIGATGPTAVVPVDSLSFQVEGTCPQQGVNVGLSTVVVASADVGNLCAMALANQSKAGMRTITLAVIRAALGTPPGVPVGAYAITQNPTGSTVVQLAAAAADRSDATCASSSVEATSGTIWLDAITAGRVAGAVDAVLADGTRLTGRFDAPACPVAVPVSELCAGASVLPAGTCLP